MKFANIKKGEILSSTMYMEVLNKGTDSVEVKDSNGNKFTVQGSGLIEKTMNSNVQFDTEQTVSRTAAVEALIGAGDCVFTVDFLKADGTERTLVGRLINTENHMGRSNVEDLLTTDKNRLRQVDHRTVKSLILKGVKYNVKK